MLEAATMQDAGRIQAVVNSFAGKGLMIQLSRNEIYEKIFEYMVYKEAGEILGVCALHPTWEDLAEIRSLAVAESNQKRGVGRSLVMAQLERARKLQIPKVFTLTYSVDFFSKVGFSVVPMETLPKKIWTDCLKCVKFPECDETAMEIIL
jgi:amino-acid N-acetyltransferase